jgi:predicted dehydrogenase
VEDLLAIKPDWVVVALPHDVAVSVTLQCLKHGCRVILEKPMGRDMAEARMLYEAGGDRLYIGFNYRFFAGIRHALQDMRAGKFGEIIGVDFLLGHGSAPGIEKTWKLDPIRAGGGCLIDPGVHLLDLCQVLAPGKIEIAGATTWDGFWKTGIEEDVHLLMKSGKMTISARVSIAYWRSTFRLEITGTEGYGIVTGRGRSYGPQVYTTGPRWGWQNAANQAASEIKVLETDGRDSFTAETEALLFPETDGDIWPPPGTAAEALAAMDLLDRSREKLGLTRSFAKA